MSSNTDKQASLGKLYIKSYGCQMNDYDSARMRDVLRQSHGLVTTENPEEADVLLLNTCSVREKPQEKVFSELGRWRLIKQQKPHVKIGVGGCVASQEGSAIVKRAPFVDLVFGPQTLHRLPELLERKENNRRAAVDVSFPEIEKFDRLPLPGATGPRAFVSIMEGCSRYCSFCVVPYTRGEEFSRDFDDVIAEVVHLTEQGVREITLLGQNVNAYQGKLHDGGFADLAMLIEYIAAIEEIKRIRFTTSHPINMTTRLIEMYAHIPKLAAHLHLPVQSGSDRILELMKRGYTAAEYREQIRAVRSMRPDISITSDFIIGFPGETQADYEATLELIEEIHFDQSFSFIYSPRPGTPAAALPDDTPVQTKLAHLQEVQKQLRAHADAVSNAMIGQAQVVLVEGPSRKGEGQFCGRTENNRIVNFDCADMTLIGQMLPVVIEAVGTNSLQGTLHPAKSR